ncbi:MAG: Gfo/Idh/MocA family protein [Chthoniobacteraceae bacterium]
MTIKICTIGCGGHSSDVHGPAQKKYAQLYPDAVLAACCDLNAAHAEEYRQRFGFARCYGDVEEMLAKEQPDAVFIIVPTAATLQVACPILRRGIPVMLEKPPGLTSAELEALIAAASEGGAPHQVGFNRRKMPLMRQAMETLERTMPPEAVFQIDYEMIRCDRRDEDFSTTAVHSIDAARFLARSPFKSAVLRYRAFKELGPTVTGVEAEVKCASGTRIVLNIQPVAGLNHERIALYAHKKTVAIEFPVMRADGPGFSLDYWENGKLLSSAPVQAAVDLFGFYSETEAFLEALRHGGHPNPLLSDCRQQVRLMEAIRNRETHVIWSDSPCHESPALTGSARR